MNSIREENMNCVKTLAKTALLLVVLSLAIIALMQTPFVNAKDSVARPFHVSGQVTFVDGYAGLPLTILDQGIASEFGRFVCVSKFTATGGIAIYYAANGDQIFAKAVGENTFEFVGGTGRFENASGAFSYEMSPGEWVPGPNNTWSYVANYKGEGAIRY